MTFPLPQIKPPFSVCGATQTEPPPEPRRIFMNSMLATRSNNNPGRSDGTTTSAGELGACVWKNRLHASQICKLREAPTSDRNAKICRFCSTMTAAKDQSANLHHPLSQFVCVRRIVGGGINLHFTCNFRSYITFVCFSDSLDLKQFSGGGSHPG